MGDDKDKKDGEDLRARILDLEAKIQKGEKELMAKAWVDKSALESGLKDLRQEFENVVKSAVNSFEEKRKAAAPESAGFFSWLEDFFK